MSQHSKEVADWVKNVETEFGVHSRQCAEKLINSWRALGYKIRRTGYKGYGICTEVERQGKWVRPLQIYPLKTRGVVVQVNLISLKETNARQKLGEELKGLEGFQWLGKLPNGCPWINTKALQNDALFDRFEKVAGHLYVQLSEPVDKSSAGEHAP